MNADPDSQPYLSYLSIRMWLLVVSLVVMAEILLIFEDLAAVLTLEDVVVLVPLLVAFPLIRSK